MIDNRCKLCNNILVKDVKKYRSYYLKETKETRYICSNGCTYQIINHVNNSIGEFFEINLNEQIYGVHNDLYACLIFKKDFSFKQILKLKNRYIDNKETLELMLMMMD